jgi:nitrogen regulatory protein P-II 1
VTKVQATIRVDRLDAVVERLLTIGVQGLTVSDAHGFGRSNRHDAVFRGTLYEIDSRPKLVLEWVGADEDVDGVIRAIVRDAGTGQTGDGKIFVSPIEEVISIRTGERGEAAL